MTYLFPNLNGWLKFGNGYVIPSHILYLSLLGFQLNHVSNRGHSAADPLDKKVLFEAFSIAYVKVWIYNIFSVDKVSICLLSIIPTEDT